MPQRRFGFAPAVELVRVDASRYTLRSEFDAIELSGESAAEFAENVLSQLKEPLGLDDIRAKLPGYSPESIARQLETLVSHGLLVEVSDEDESRPAPFPAFMQLIGLDGAEATRRLAATTVAVFGLEAHGAHVALKLAQLGVGAVRLVDPFPVGPSHLALMPIADQSFVGLSRQEAVAGLLSPLGTHVEAASSPDLNADSTRGFVQGCDLVFGCWDRGYGVATHWLNQAAHDTGVPVLFGELRATSTLTGPLYLPSRSACWMCYRMRAIACSPDFEQAMAFEEHLDRSRRPDLVGRSPLPVLSEILASAMTLEALRLLLGIHPPVFVDNVVEYEALSNETKVHPLLAVPDCPVCKKKARGAVQLSTNS